MNKNWLHKCRVCKIQPFFFFALFGLVCFYSKYITSISSDSRSGGEEEGGKKHGTTLEL